LQKKDLCNFRDRLRVFATNLPRLAIFLAAIYALDILLLTDWSNFVSPDQTVEAAASSGRATASLLCLVRVTSPFEDAGGGQLPTEDEEAEEETWNKNEEKV
jgi:hypothetical protein